MTQKHPVGSIWAAKTGEKVIVIAFDPLTDALIVYDYVRKQEFPVTRHAIDDDSFFDRPWNEREAYEKGVLEGAKGYLTPQLHQAFMENARNEDGPPYAVFRVPIPDSEDIMAYAYGEYIVGANLKIITPLALNEAVRDFCTMVRGDMAVNNVDRIVWRTQPEMDIFHNEITGERKMKIYARFVAFSRGYEIKFQNFYGARVEGLDVRMINR
jgi:hypothetical protein